jgi:predicted transposase YbfD/YdcC
VLAALKPEAFQKCFESWLASRVALDASGQPRLIAIDGKTQRRSHDRAAGLGPLHIVSAWATEQGLALGQVATEEKSNEITAIPELLGQIDVQGALITIDAMGCQKEIAAQIVDQEGDYLLAVKDNQPKLRAAIEQFFVEHLENDFASHPHRHHETHDQGHGRVDERYYYLARPPKDFAPRDQWPGLKAIGCAVRNTEHTDGRTTEDVRYYIASRYHSGQRFAAAVRGHWGIENSLHWVLDMNFREDENRTRERTLADNMSWLRRFAVSLHKQHPFKDSIRGKMQRANWNTDFLTEVLTGKAT